jgi:Predicted membrane protein (DUF2339)
MSDDLSARLDRLEAELRRLGAEVREVRYLLRTEREPAPAVSSAVLPQAPPLEPEVPQPPPVTKVRPTVDVPSSVRERPPTPPRRSFGDLAHDWDLVGARGFAIAGGAVMALGIGLFFVLASNRGWIDERARVALGAIASALVLGAGLVLRARFGQYWAALAAVGAGIAGAYATLAAAAVRYDLVPDGLALPLAGAIAMVGTLIAIRWSSQVIAAIGLVGAALAPALQALDVDVTWESVAFALIVLVAGAIVAVPRGWKELLLGLSAIVGGQVVWLVGETVAPASAGTVAVAGVLLVVLLGISVALQLAVRRSDLEPLALAYALVPFALAIQFAGRLFDERADRGLALLAIAAVWALVFCVLERRRLLDLGLVVGTSALALAAVGTAFLLSDAALTIAWAAEAVVLAVLAARLRDARLQTMGIVYGSLASIQVLATAGAPGLLFDDSADHASAVVPLAAAAAALIVAGLLAPARHRERTESGLLAFVGEIRRALSAHRRGLRESLVVAGIALATLAVSFGLVSVSFEWGHVAATALAAIVGAAILGRAGASRSDGLAAAGYLWLGVIVIVSVAYDIGVFYDEISETSIGGWSAIAAAAGLLAGAYAHRLAWQGSTARDTILGVASGIAAALGALGFGVLTETTMGLGLGLLVAAAAYVCLAANVFRREGFRNVSTILWALGLLLLVGAESALVVDSIWRAIVIAATALAIGALGGRVAESRLWLAGSSLALATSTIVVLVQVQPWLTEGELTRSLALASAACAVSVFGLAALRWREPGWREPVTLLWGAGIVLVLTCERVLLGDWESTVVAAALTGAAVACLARPLREERLWAAGAIFVAWCTVVSIAFFTPPSHVFTASESPAEALWVLVGCVLALAVVALTAEVRTQRFGLLVVTGGLALYGLSLAILEVAERVSTASVATDFERGHTAVSGLWALVGLALLVIGLLRRSPVLRYCGLALFGLSVAKIFVYDLAELSSVARAFSFILVGGLLLAGGFFLQRLSDRMGSPRPPARAMTS